MPFEVAISCWNFGRILNRDTGRRVSRVTCAVCVQRFCFPNLANVSKYRIPAKLGR